MGFCVEDWNINMAVAPRAPLSRSDTKAFIRLSRLGKFLLEQCSSHLPAFIAGHASRIRGCNGLSNTRCKILPPARSQGWTNATREIRFSLKGFVFYVGSFVGGFEKAKFSLWKASQIAYIHSFSTKMWRIFLTIALDMVNAKGKFQKNSETLL